MRRLALRAFPAVLAAALALAGASSSPGGAMRALALDYTAAASSSPDSAVLLLTDSLSALVRPGVFSVAEARGVTGSPLLGRTDERGFQVLLPEEGGGYRTLWLRSEGRVWRISGDTYIDMVLGSAATLCREHAVSVVPEILSGSPAGSFSCPVSGQAYTLDASGSLLVCPDGHLGAGLEIGGDACGARRAEVAAEVARYIAAGFPMPSGFDEMWTAGGGAFGQPGGYRCPDNGYSYYSIADSAVFCPFHQAGTPVLP